LETHFVQWQWICEKAGAVKTGQIQGKKICPKMAMIYEIIMLIIGTGYFYS
jgi:hypothetical protein